MSRNEEPYYGRIEDDGHGNRIIRAIEQEPIRPEILPVLPEEAHVLNSDKRCSEKDRADAIDFLSEMHAEGYITAAELEIRRAHVLESVATRMLVRITRDFPETIDQWLKKKAHEEWKRQEAAKPKEAPKPAAPEPEDEEIPGYALAGLGIGAVAIAGGIAATVWTSPLFTSLAIIVLGIACIAVTLWAALSKKKE